MTTTKSPYSLRMRQLPKPEYKLMKALVKEYNLLDESELFAVALRLFSEVEIYKNGEGKIWITNVIDSYRAMTNAQRSEEYGE